MIHHQASSSNRHPTIIIFFSLLTACASDPATPSADARVDAPAVFPDAPCSSDRECSALGGVCDRTTSRCVECNAMADCPAGRSCIGSRCVTPVACTTSRMCPGQVCSTSRGYCVDCDADTDCPRGQTCRNAACVNTGGTCQVARDCPATTPLCDTVRHVCAVCLAATDCPARQTCRDGRCVSAACTPGATTCPAGSATRSVCATDGLSSRDEACPTPAHATMPRCGASNACTFNCEGGFADCDGNVANGCESDLSAPTSCGRCGETCMATQACREGTCLSATIRNYLLAPAPASSTFVDVCAMPGVVMALAMADDAVVFASLPFTFHFWSTTLAAGTMLNASSNGYLNADGFTTNNTYHMMGLPQTASPNLVIAPYWADNYNIGAQCFATLGSAPTRRWVAEWSATVPCCTLTAPRFGYEAILHEGTDVIEFLYDDRTRAMPRTIGIEDEGGMRAVSACPAGMQCAPTSNYRFTPAP
jgi:hypothetical protein